MKGAAHRQCCTTCNADEQQPGRRGLSAEKAEDSSCGSAAGKLAGHLRSPEASHRTTYGS